MHLHDAIVALAAAGQSQADIARMLGIPATDVRSTLAAVVPTNNSLPAAKADHAAGVASTQRTRALERELRSCITEDAMAARKIMRQTIDGGAISMKQVNAVARLVGTMSTLASMPTGEHEHAVHEHAPSIDDVMRDVRIAVAVHVEGRGGDRHARGVQGADGSPHLEDNGSHLEDTGDGEAIEVGSEEACDGGVTEKSNEERSEE